MNITQMTGQQLIATLSAEVAKISADGTYDFLWSTTDISAYAGVEGTKASYLAHVWDSAGKRLVGYFGAAGVAEDFNELVTGDDSTFHSDTAFWSKETGWAIGSEVATKTAGTAANLNHANLYSAGMLIKHSLDIVSISGASAYVMPYVGGTVVGDWHNYTTTGTKTGYTTATVGTPYGIYATATYAGDVDNFIFKQVTDCPATALHVWKDITCATRGWLSKDTGFNYNAASYTVQIFAVR